MKRAFAVGWVRFFFATLPLWEIYRSFFQSRVQIGPLALEEAWLLFAALSVLVLGAGHALKRGRKRAMATALAALAVLAAFTVVHAAFAAGFNGSLLPGAAPDFAVECYYCLRLYLAPAALLAGAVLLELSPRELFPGVKIAAALFAGVVVLCCLTGTGFAAYKDGNTALAGGFFTWFSLTPSSDLAGSTAKGFFSSGNDVGSVLFILTPLLCREALAKERRWYDVVLLGLTGFASVAVGTRVGAFGFFLACGAALVLTAADALRRGTRRAALVPMIPALAVIAVLVPLFLLSPGLLMQTARSRDASAEERTPPAASAAVLAEPEEESALLAPYLAEHGWDHYIDPWFVEIYPAENDPAFWRGVLARDGRLNRDNRRFKTELIARVARRDGRFGDVLLGIGRTSGVPYSERDLVFQGQIYGVLGAALYLLPFAGAALAAGFTAFRRFRRRRDMTRAAALLISLAAAFGAAYAAGHVFDTPLTTYILLLPAAMAFTGLINDLRERSEESKERKQA